MMKTFAHPQARKKVDRLLSSVATKNPFPRQAGKEKIRRAIAPVAGLPPYLLYQIKKSPPILVPTRRNDSANWHTDGTVKGQRVRLSTGTQDLELAWLFCFSKQKQMLENVELEQSHHRSTVSMPRRGHCVMTLKNLVEEYIKARKISSDAQGKLARVLKHFAEDMPVTLINQDMVDKVAARMFGPGHKPATYGRDLISPLKAVLRFGARRKWCAPPDFDPVPSSEPLKDILLPFDMERLVAASEEADADLWLFGAVYGHHLSEVVRITGRDVDLRYNRLTVRMKSRRNSVVLRRVRIVPRLLPMFKRLVSKLKDLSEPLFRRLDGSPLGGPSGTQASAYVRRRLQICLATANVVPPTGTFTHRSFRTTMATWMISASGGAMLFVMRYGGWRTLRMVEGYSADQDPEIVPDVLKFLGLPPATDIVSWMKLPLTSPSHGGVPGLH